MRHCHGNAWPALRLPLVAVCCTARPHPREAPRHTARARLAAAAHISCGAWRPPIPGHLLFSTCRHEGAARRGPSKVVRAMPPTNRAPRHGSAAAGRGTSWPSTRDDIILKRSGVCAARGPSMLPPVARPGAGKLSASRTLGQQWRTRVRPTTAARRFVQDQIDRACIVRPKGSPARPRPRGCIDPPMWRRRP